MSAMKILKLLSKFNDITYMKRCVSQYCMWERIEKRRATSIFALYYRHLHFTDAF
jgi:hypothetical protein